MFVGAEKNLNDDECRDRRKCRSCCCCEKEASSSEKCVCMYMYVCACTCEYVCACICMYTYAHACMYICMYVCMYACTLIEYMYDCVYVFASVFVCSLSFITWLVSQHSSSACPPLPAFVVAAATEQVGPNLQSCICVCVCVCVCLCVCSCVFAWVWRYCVCLNLAHL